MKAGVLKETWPGETRVAVVPGVVQGLAKAGIELLIEAGSGEAAGFPDGQYVEKGAAVVARGEVLARATLLLSVRSFAGAHDKAALDALDARHVLVGFLDPLQRPEGARALAERGLDLVRARAGAAHLARAEHGRAVLDRDDGRLQGGAARGRAAAADDADDDDRGGHDRARPRARDRRGRRRAAGDRDRAPARGGGRGVRRAAGRQGAGAEPRGEVRGAAARGGRGRGQGRLREGAGRGVLSPAARAARPGSWRRATS